MEADIFVSTQESFKAVFFYIRYMIPFFRRRMWDDQQMWKIESDHMGASVWVYMPWAKMDIVLLWLSLR